MNSSMLTNLARSSRFVTREAVEADVAMVAGLLLGTINAPEQEIYRVARGIVAAIRAQEDRP